MEKPPAVVRPYEYHLVYGKENYPTGAYLITNGSSLASRAGFQDNDNYGNDTIFPSRTNLKTGSYVYVVFYSETGTYPLGFNEDGVLPAFRDLLSAKKYIFNNMRDLNKSHQYELSFYDEEVSTVYSSRQAKNTIVNWYGDHLGEFGDEIRVSLPDRSYRSYFYGIMKFAIVDIDS